VRALGIAMLLAFAGTACSGTETGNPSPATSPQLRFATVPSDAIATDAPVAPAAIYLGIGPITALVCEAGSAVLSSPAGVTVTESVPSAPVSVDAVSACGLAVELQPQTIGPEGAMEVATALIYGATSDGVSIVIGSSASKTVSLVPTAPPLLVDAGSQWLLTFMVDTWFSGIDFTGAQRGPNGIRIDGTTNTDLLAPIEARLGMGAALRRDLNGNGRVDAEDVPVALPP
jgi:hypothetical protein